LSKQNSLTIQNNTNKFEFWGQDGKAIAWEKSPYNQTDAT
jgi:hypothetical protein